MSSTYEKHLIFKLKLGIFSMHIRHIKQKLNETFVCIVTKPGSIFWNMEYFGILHILEYGIFWNYTIQIISKTYFGYRYHVIK